MLTGGGNRPASNHLAKVRIRQRKPPSVFGEEPWRFGIFWEVSQALEAQITLLIDLLDTLDGDPDLEPDSDLEDGADSEPSLGLERRLYAGISAPRGAEILYQRRRSGSGGRALWPRTRREDAEPDVDVACPYEVVRFQS